MINYSKILFDYNDLLHKLIHPVSVISNYTSEKDFCKIVLENRNACSNCLLVLCVEF